VPELPRFATGEELAEFVDTHDLAPYWDNMEPIGPAALRFKRGDLTSVRVQLTQDALQRVRKAAARQGMAPEAFMGQLIGNAV